MMDMLDTSILVDIIRGKFLAQSWIMTKRGGTFLIPGYVSFDLIQGARDRREARSIWQMIQPYDLVWPSITACETALRRFDMDLLAHGMGILDSLIAATALEHGATLYTLNIKHFRHIPGLQVVRPY